MLTLRLLDKDPNHYPLAFQSLPATPSRMVYAKSNPPSRSFQKITQFFSANSENLFFDLNLANYPALRKQAFAPAAIFRLRRHDPHCLQQKVNALLTENPRNSDLPSVLEAVFSHFTTSAKSKYFIEHTCSTLYLLASDPINRTALPKFVELLLQSNVFTKTTTVKLSDAVRPYLINALSTLLQQNASLPTVATGNLLKQLIQESDPNQPHVLEILDRCLAKTPLQVLKHIFSPDANGNTTTHILLNSPYCWRTPYATLNLILRHCPDELKNGQFSCNNKGETPLHLFAKAVKENDLEEVKLKGRRERPKDYLLASSIQDKVTDIINACPEPLRSDLFNFNLDGSSLCTYASGRLAFYLMTLTYAHRGFYTNSKHETALHQFAAGGDRDFDAEIVEWIKDNLNQDYEVFTKNEEGVSIFHLLSFACAKALAKYDKENGLNHCYSSTKKGPALTHYINNGMSVEELKSFLELCPTSKQGHVFKRDAKGNTVLFVLLAKFNDLRSRFAEDPEMKKATRASFERQIILLLEEHTQQQLEEFVTSKVVNMLFALGFEDLLKITLKKVNSPVLYARLLTASVIFGCFDQYAPLVQSIKTNRSFYIELFSNPHGAFRIKDLYDKEATAIANEYHSRIHVEDFHTVYLQPSEIVKHFQQKHAKARAEAKESIKELRLMLKKGITNISFEIFTNPLCFLPLAAFQARQLPEIFYVFPHLSEYHLKLAVPALPVDLFVREILKKENLKAKIVLPFATVEQKIALLDEEIKTTQFQAAWIEVKKEIAVRVEGLKHFSDVKQRNREIIAIKKLLKDAHVPKQTIYNLKDAAIYLQGETNAELKYRLKQYIKKTAQEIAQVRTEYPEVQKSISNLQLSVSYEPEPHFRNAITWSLLDKPLRLPFVKGNGEIQLTDNYIDASYYEENRAERVKMINGVEHYLLPIGQDKWLPAEHFQIDTNLEQEINDWKSEHPGWEDYEEIRLELHHT